jgi:hypothetical protein
MQIEHLRPGPEGPPYYIAPDAVPLVVSFIWGA